MGFEAPLALLALAAAGLPIAAHLLRRRDLPRLKLPTVALLRRAESASRRRVKLVDLLLLLVRVLMIALAALAVAGPFLRVTLAYGDGSVTSLVVVVDDSMSMAERGEPSLLAQAVGRAGEVIDSLPAGSEVAVVLAGAPPRILMGRTEDLGAVERALEGIDPHSARGTALTGALELAERELAGALHADRRVLVLSDLARAGAGELALPGSLSGRGVDVRFEPLGQEASTRNAAVVEVRATPDPTAEGVMSVAVEVRASGELDGQTLPLTLSRDGLELDRGRVEIASGRGRATLHARTDAEQPGATVSLQVEDAVELDDQRPVLLRPPSGVRVLVAQGDRRPGASSRFLSRAIDLAPSEGGALSRRQVDPDTLAAMDLSEADVVVLADLPAPSERTARRLREHVERGGGLLVAPGPHFEPRTMRARLDELLPATPVAAVATQVRGPLAAPGSDLLPATVTGLEQTTTERRIGLEDVDPAARVELIFSDGAPALVVGRHADGRVALLATSLDDEWTTLPYRPGYLPLMAGLLRALAPGTSTPDTPLTPGEAIRLRPPAGTVRLRLSAPDGEVFELDEGALGEEGVRFEDTVAAGLYRARIATREAGLHAYPRLSFTVAPPPEESDLSAEAPPEAAETAPAGERAARSVVRRPLARWLFLLVGLLAVTEAAFRLRAAHLLRRPA